MIKRLGELLVFIAGVYGASDIEISFGDVVGQPAQLANRPQDDPLRYDVKCHDCACAADKPGDDNPYAVEKDRSACFRGGPFDYYRAYRFVPAKGACGTLRVVAGYATLRRAENADIIEVKRVFPVLELYLVG
jgi:hypothetical protein